MQQEIKVININIRFFLNRNILIDFIIILISNDSLFNMFIDRVFAVLVYTYKERHIRIFVRLWRFPQLPSYAINIALKMVTNSIKLERDFISGGLCFRCLAASKRNSHVSQNKCLSSSS